MKSIAIIGAGLAGITLANKLNAYAEVTVFEKARSPGGRMSTRRAEPFHFDHGAQYFTAKHTDFVAALAEPLSEGVVELWPGNHIQLIARAQGVDKTRLPSAENRYVAVPGMNALVKFLAEGVNVLCQTRVSCLKRVASKWALFDEANQLLGEYDWVISTAPRQQSLDLLPETFAHLAALQQCSLLPCFALMLGFNGPLDLDFDSAQVVGGDIAWIANNSTKPGRPSSPCLVIHASAQWSEANVSAAPEFVISHLSEAASNLTGVDLLQAEHAGVHRWLYAQATRQATQQVFLDADLNLAAAGDWCWGGRVEFAFLNALETANAIVRMIQ